MDHAHATAVIRPAVLAQIHIIIAPAADGVTKMTITVERIEEEMELERLIGETLNQLYQDGKIEYLHFSPAYDASCVRFAALECMKATRTPVSPEELAERAENEQA